MMYMSTCTAGTAALGAVWLVVHLVPCACDCPQQRLASVPADSLATFLCAGARRVMSQSLPPSPSGRDPYRAAIMGGSPLRQHQQHSRIPAGIGSSRSPPQTGAMPANLAGFSRAGSPPGGTISPPMGPSPSRGASPRVSPSPRVVREQWGEASPRISGRGFRGAGRMAAFVSQSLDGSLMQAGAAREQQGQMCALQQVSWTVLMGEVLVPLDVHDTCPPCTALCTTGNGMHAVPQQP